ncbi:nucleotide-diphospho-sugar transferase, partial [Dunaliella salina]
IAHIDFGSTDIDALFRFIEANPGLGSTYLNQWAVQLGSSPSTPPVLTTDMIFSEKIGACVSLKNLSSVDVSANHCPKPAGGQTDEAAPYVSFLLPLQNNAKIACTCVFALFKTLTEVEGAELIIVDDGSTVDMSPIVYLVRRLRFLFGFRTVMLRLPQTVGFGGALNYGAGHASGRFACFLNADTFVVPGWLHPLIATFSVFQRAAVVGPLFIGHGNLITEAGGYVYANAQAGNFMRGVEPNYEALYARRVNYISAACIVIRIDVFRHVGGFDEMYGRGYYEDTDLAMAVQSAGWDVIYQPLSIVYHQEGSSFGSDSPLKQYYMKVNRIRYYKKWREHLTKSVPHLTMTRGLSEPCTC